jgi:hypothetical protein
MKWSRVVGLFAVLSLSAPKVSAQAKDQLRDETEGVAGDILTGPSMEKLEELSDRFGARLTGTQSYEDAAKWAAEQFRAMGINDVKLESFTVPNGWQRGWAQSQIYSPVQRKLHLETVSWSPSTPPGGLRGEVAIISDISAEGLRSKAVLIKNRIILLDADRIFEDGFNKTYPKLAASYAIFKSLGAKALVFPDAVPNNVLGDWVDMDNGTGNVQPLPMAEIGMEDARLIRRLLAKGPVTIGFSYENQVSGPVQASNVIAEIRGSEKPDEWVIVGAHLDSWDLASGAQDDGTGVIMILEAARAIAALPHPPRRSIRFALFAGEEPGLLGSKAYVQRHAAELGHCIAVVITDNGSGRPRGWKVEGREDLKEALAELTSRYLKEYGADQISLETTFDTDQGFFMLEGVPALDLWIEEAQYNAVHHKSSDTFDKVDPITFKADGAIVAVTAYWIAQKQEPVAPHLSHAAVAEILKKAELDAYLIAHGDWKP